MPYEKKILLILLGSCIGFILFIICFKKLVTRIFRKWSTLGAGLVLGGGSGAILHWVCYSLYRVYLQGTAPEHTVPVKNRIVSCAVIIAVMFFAVLIARRIQDKKNGRNQSKSAAAANRFDGSNRVEMIAGKVKAARAAGKTVDRIYCYHDKLLFAFRPDRDGETYDVMYFNAEGFKNLTFGETESEGFVKALAGRLNMGADTRLGALDGMSPLEDKIFWKNQEERVRQKYGADGFLDGILYSSADSQDSLRDD